MADMLSDGAAWMADQLAASASLTVAYKRGANSSQFLATIGKSMFESSGQNGVTEQWESRDTYGIGVDTLIVGTYSAARRVFNVRRTGKLYLLDEKTDGTDDEPSGSNVGLVIGTIRTRRYNMGNMHSKRFTRALSDVVLPNAGSITVQAKLFNPDAPVTLVPGQSNDTGAEEDYTLKQPIRRKAHAAELIFQTNLQRPEIRNVSIEAALEGLPQTDTRNAA